MRYVNLYTEGKEFYYEGSVTEYVGYYNIESVDNSAIQTIFSGRSRDENSYRLIPIPTDIARYKDAGGADVPEPITIVIPNPSKSDYKQGWFNRYFARQTNDITAPYYEIDKAQYEKIKGRGVPFYSAVQFRWKISGPMFDVTGSLDGKSVVTEPGVVNTNNRTIKSLMSKYSGLTFRLQNLTEFWEGQREPYFGPALKDEGGTLKIPEKNLPKET